MTAKRKELTFSNTPIIMIVMIITILTSLRPWILPFLPPRREREWKRGLEPPTETAESPVHCNFRRPSNSRHCMTWGDRPHDQHQDLPREWPYIIDPMIDSMTEPMTSPMTDPMSNRKTNIMTNNKLWCQGSFARDLFLILKDLKEQNSRILHKGIQDCWVRRWLEVFKKEELKNPFLIPFKSKVFENVILKVVCATCITFPKEWN